MKNKLFVSAMLVCLLALGLVVSGCDTGGGSGGGGDDDTTEYTLTWGAWDGATYSDVSSSFSVAGYSLTAAGTNAGYLTSDKAVGAYNILANGGSGIPRFDDSGTISGSFETLLDYSTQGIGLPAGLKSSLRGQKANAPLAGVFQYYLDGGSNGGAPLPGVSVFYVTKSGGGGDTYVLYGSGITNQTEWNSVGLTGITPSALIDQPFSADQVTMSFSSLAADPQGLRYSGQSEAQLRELLVRYGNDVHTIISKLKSQEWVFYATTNTVDPNDYADIVGIKKE
jgi:hypothetical protein